MAPSMISKFNLYWSALWKQRLRMGHGKLWVWSLYNRHIQGYCRCGKLGYRQLKMKANSQYAKLSWNEITGDVKTRSFWKGDPTSLMSLVTCSAEKLGILMTSTDTRVSARNTNPLERIEKNTTQMWERMNREGELKRGRYLEVSRTKIETFMWPRNRSVILVIGIELYKCIWKSTLLRWSPQHCQGRWRWRPVHLSTPPSGTHLPHSGSGHKIHHLGRRIMWPALSPKHASLWLLVSLKTTKILRASGKAGPPVSWRPSWRTRCRGHSGWQPQPPAPPTRPCKSRWLRKSKV